MDTVRIREAAQEKETAKPETGFERVNYHGHCEHCRHARGPARAYVEEAVRKGLVRLGFSDHMPWPDDRFGLRMPYAELEAYMEEIRQLKEEFADRLQILCGFEGEYVRKDRDYLERLLSHPGCEYLLLGQHFYETRQGELINVYDIRDTAQYEDYAENLVEAMKTGYFRYVAHPDLIFLNDLAMDSHCERACHIIIEGAARYGTALEYNANGFRRGLHSFVDGERYQYPLEKFWDQVRGAGVEVYVGSDCHEPAQVYDEIVELAYEKLRKKGIAARTDW